MVKDVAWGLPGAYCVGEPLEAPSLEPGFHDVSLSVRTLPAGIYYYKLETGEGNRSGKFLIVR
jgi:hypothetical protein